MIKEINLEKCNGCSICVEFCTKDVLRFDEETQKAYVAYFNDCQTCYTCEINCPTKAIFVHPIARKKFWPW